MVNDGPNLPLSTKNHFTSTNDTIKSILYPKTINEVSSPSKLSQTVSTSGIPKHYPPKTITESIEAKTPAHGQPTNHPSIHRLQWPTQHSLPYRQTLCLTSWQPSPFKEDPITPDMNKKPRLTICTDLGSTVQIS